MKKYLNRKNICLTILILIIIAGAITACIVGFEKSMQYKAGTRIEVYIPQGYEREDIINIAKESFNTEEIFFLDVEKLNQIAGIKLITEYTEEQLENFENKITEKYQIEEIELYEIVIPETKISTIIEPYTLPVLLTTLISLVYIGIKYLKSGEAIKVSLKVLFKLFIALGLYFSIIVLFRLPVNIYTIPVALVIYIIVLLITVNNIKR